MTVFATQNQRLSNVIKHEYEPSLAWCRDVVVLNDVAQVLQLGAVLGKVTATGKYKLVEATATDGSQVAAAVYIGNAAGEARAVSVAATTDTTVLTLTRGPVILSKAALSFGASVNTDTLRNTLYAQLKAVGMIAETTI